MKKPLLLLLPFAALLANAAEPAAPERAGTTPATNQIVGAAATSTPAPAAQSSASTASQAEPVAPAPEAASTAASQDSTETKAAEQPEEEPLPPGMLRLNFRGVSLDQVLDYLSEAAGFIINLQATPRGRVDVWSNTPVTKEEALNILDSVLRKNGLAAIRNERTLTIISRDEAKIHDIPVRLGSDPNDIPRNDEIVTQIIPVRFVEVVQLARDLQPLVSVQTTMTANEAGNSIVITDTQANIRRVAEIIKAIDMGAEDVTEVRVFHLQNSDPIEVSELLTSLFPDESRTGGSSSPVQYGGFSRFLSSRFGGPPPGSSSSSGGQNQRIRKRARVLAVPDARTSSVVVSAAKDLIPQIEAVVQELDASNARKQTVHMYQLQNADPEEVQEVLQDMFERNVSSSSRSSQNRNDSSLRNRRTSQSTGSTANRTSRSTSGRSTSSTRR
jgi:general secretion pathway protein D